MRLTWPEGLFAAGLFLGLVAVGRGGPAVMDALAEDTGPPYHVVGHAALLAVAACMIHAGKLRRPWRKASTELFVGWGLLTLAAITGAAIFVHSWVEPRIVIALVFTGAFALIGAFFIFLDARSAPRRVLRSERDRKDDAARRLTGDLDWRVGHVEEMAVKGPGPVWWPVVLGVGFLAAVALLIGELRLIGAVATLGAALAGWLFWARRRTRKRLIRFGTSRFVPPALPIPLGDGVAGRIEIPDPPRAETATLRLRCLKRWFETQKPRRIGDGGSSRQITRLETLFEEEISATLRDGAAEVAFKPPKDLPAARDGRREAVFWELTATAPDPAVSYRAVFRLPVVRGGR